MCISFLMAEWQNTGFGCLFSLCTRILWISYSFQMSICHTIWQCTNYCWITVNVKLCTKSNFWFGASYFNNNEIMFIYLFVFSFSGATAGRSLSNISRYETAREKSNCRKNRKNPKVTSLGIIVLWLPKRNQYRESRHRSPASRTRTGIRCFGRSKNRAFRCFAAFYKSLYSRRSGPNVRRWWESDRRWLYVAIWILHAL